ncbi:Ca2+/Na+ antiporter [Peptoniphilus koenoeneniae]|uniref:Ca2+/Na+ antiporter n=1 Tax=Peptoniphilus koenoeneniae TaxID=507751 RepID=A0ABU0AW48_9FIRM|nr:MULTISPECIES: PH domain-containing protein [Peptoniphilus]ERT57532.1 PH domain protein [Peptoniphilus sp. BV3C26]MDQ0275429.1 Ca2+/Na+ antiporter [Peptoniphilus koenoeneniae]
MFNLIMFLTYIFICIITHFQMENAFKYKNGYLFATRIPFSYMEDERVIEILEDGKKKKKIFLFLSLLMAISIWISGGYSVFFFSLFMIIQVAIYNLIIYKCMKDLRAYKKTFIGEKHDYKFTDTRASIEINKERVKPFYYFLLIFLMLLSMSFTLLLIKGQMGFILSFTNFILISSLIFIAFIYRQPVRVYSQDTRINIEKNTENIIKRERDFLKIGFIFCLLSFLLAFILRRDFYNINFLITYVILFGLSVLFMFFKYSREDSKGKTDLVQDEDSYWDIFGYKNPNDRRIFIPSLIFSGNFEINRGNKWGRIIFISINLIVILLVFSIPYFLSPSPYKYDLNENSISIKAKFYKDRIDFKDIKDISLGDFPNVRAVRTNGTSIESQGYGSFSLEGLGDVRLYYYKDCKEVITIKGKKIYMFNEKNKEETEKLYKEIRGTYDKYRKSK